MVTLVLVAVLIISAAGFVKLKKNLQEPTVKFFRYFLSAVAVTAGVSLFIDGLGWIILMSWLKRILGGYGVAYGLFLIVFGIMIFFHREWFSHSQDKPSS